MRTPGMLSCPEEAARAEHVCWVYEDAGSFAEVALGYLVEGLARGERLLCIGDTVVAALSHDGKRLGDVEEMIRRGALQVLDLAGAYDRDGAVHPREQLAYFDGATRQALADGYSGLCVVADATALAADDAQRPGLLEWEHLADHFIGSGSGMCALCAYDGTRLDDRALADLGAMHPLVHAVEEPPFYIRFDADTITLAGEVDMLGAERLGRLLASSPVRSPVVVLDLARVDFMDVAGSRTIARWAIGLREQGTRLVLLGSSRLFRKMWTLLGLSEVTGASFDDGPADRPPALSGR